MLHEIADISAILTFILAVAANLVGVREYVNLWVQLT
jgi:hypothetical protein